MSEENKVVEGRKDLDILNKMKNLPGGLVIIPLVIAVLLATFVPQVFQIGGYVTALFYEGNSCMMGFFLMILFSATFLHGDAAGVQLLPAAMAAIGCGAYLFVALMRHQVDFRKY